MGSRPDGPEQADISAVLLIPDVAMFSRTESVTKTPFGQIPVFESFLESPCLASAKSKHILNEKLTPFGQWLTRDTSTPEYKNRELQFNFLGSHRQVTFCLRMVRARK